MTVQRSQGETFRTARESFSDATRLVDREPWMAEAVCAQVDNDGFFPEKDRADTARRAKTVCATCPVIDPCLQFALDHHERFGVWGGKSERERRKILRDRAGA